MTVVPVITSAASGPTTPPRALFLVFDNRSKLEEAITTAYREVYKAERVYLEEKKRQDHRIEYEIKYYVRGKIKSEKRFKVYSYGKYYVIVSGNLGLPTLDPDGHLIAYILTLKAKT